MKTRSKYIFQGKTYTTRNACKLALMMRSNKGLRVTNSYLDTLIDLRIVLEVNE